MKNKTFGYVRVSSTDQNEGRQLAEMKAAGVDERDIYVDKESGKDFDRKAYKALIDQLRVRKFPTACPRLLTRIYSTRWPKECK